MAEIAPMRQHAGVGYIKGQNTASAWRWAVCLWVGLCAAVVAGPAWADCSNPFGREGDIVYAGNAGIVVFCDGTDWKSMSGDSRIGAISSSGWCQANVAGTQLNCNAAAPQDARIGSLTANRFCVANGAGTGLDCTATNPSVAAGADQQVQFNNAGAFAGSAGLLWNNATSLLTVAGVSVTGNISANRFIGAHAGDGSLLTNINAAAITGLTTDRIVSTSANIVVGNGGTISFTTGGTSGTAYIDTTGRYVGAGVSTTGAGNFMAVSVTGGISTTGNISANQFIGDGSRLTNISASAVTGLTTDRIISTSANIVAGNGGTISFTTGGTSGTAYFGTTGQLVLPTISTTGAVSVATTGYFGGDVRVSTSSFYISQTTGSIGIGTTSPGDLIEIRNGSNSINRGITLTSGGRGISIRNDLSTGQLNGLVLNSDTAIIATGSNNTTDIASLVLSNWQSTSLFGIRITSNGIAINQVTPRTSLDVSGTLKISNGGQPCDTNRAGAIRYTGSDFQICYGTGGWASLVDASGTTVTPDRITSGTTDVRARADGSISFTTLGTTTGYFYNGQLVANAVSTTGIGRFTNVSVTGGISATGNISANQFIGDGSRLTNISASAVTGLTTDRIVSTSANIVVGNGGTISFTTGGTSGTAYFDTIGRLVAPGISATTNQSSFTTVYASRFASIGTSASVGVLTINPSGTVTGGSWNEGLVVLPNGTGSSGMFLRAYDTGSTSGTWGIFRNGNTGNLQFNRDADVGTNAFSAITIVSNTGNVGIGTGNPLAMLTINANASATSAVFAGGVPLLRLQGSTASWSEPAIDFVEQTNNPIARIAAKNTGSGAGHLMFLTRASANTTPTEKVRIQDNGNVGIGTITPTTSLEVSGTISATAFVGNGAGLTNLNAAAITGLTTDRIVSTSANIVVGNGGTISFTTGGTSGTAYFGTTGQLVLPTISTTGAVSVASTGYFGGSVGVGAANTTGMPMVIQSTGLSTTLAINRPGSGMAGMAIGGTPVAFSIGWAAYNGSSAYLGQGNIVLQSNTNYIGLNTSSPSATLHVAGNARITSWTMINANTTATTPLEVSGTVSATAFVGDGSGLTNLNPGAISVDRIISGTVSAVASNSNNRIDISGSINLPAQNVAGVTTNMVRQNGSPFISTFRPTGNDGFNLFIGLNSGNTTMVSSTSAFGASYNTAVGQNTLTNNTTGYSNTASGISALFSNTTGYQNIASGVNAMYSNTTGYNNTASGGWALQANTTGYSNTASGVNALFSNTTGYGNTALGANSLSDISGSTNNNTALGANTGRGITTGSSNTILGANVTGLPAALSNTVIIADGSGNRRIYVHNTGFTGINLASGTLPTAMLEVSGTISATGLTINGVAITGSGGTSDRIISTSANIVAGNGGTISFTTGGVSGTAYFDTIGRLVAPGISATTNQSSFTTVFASGYLGVGTSSNGGSLSVLAGTAPFGTALSILESTDATSNRASISLGNWLMMQDTNGNGTRDFAIYDQGVGAPRIYIASGGNILMGTGITPAVSLTVVGEVQVSNSGVVCGSSTAGAIRYSGGSLSYCNGSSFTALATGAGGTSDRIISTSANIVAGNGGTISFTTGGVSGTAYFSTTGQLVLPTISTTGAVSVATTGYFGGNMNIGGINTSVTATLFVGRNSGSIIMNAGNGAIEIASGDDGASFIDFKGSSNLNADHVGRILYTDGFGMQLITSQTMRVAISESGNVGIGVMNPTTLLEVSGTISATGITIGGDISYTGVMTDTSDRRLKENVQPLGEAMLAKVGLLNPVTFTMKGRPGLTESGFIAQDVEAIFPWLVVKSGPEEMRSLNYVGLIAPLTGAVKELKAQNEAQAKQIDTLQQQLQTLAREVQAIKATKNPH